MYKMKTEDDILDEAIDVRPEDIRPYAFVSKMALDSQFIGYCYREHPETKIDSGWRFMHGTEDEEYLEEQENCISIYLEEVLDIHPELKEIFDSPVHSEYEWNESSGSYMEL